MTQRNPIIFTILLMASIMFCAAMPKSVPKHTAQASSYSILRTEGVPTAIYSDGQVLSIGTFFSPELLDEFFDTAGPAMSTSWVDAKGLTQTVTTPCGQYSDEDSCAKVHDRAVQALMRYYPKPKPVEKTGYIYQFPLRIRVA